MPLYRVYRDPVASYAVARADRRPRRPPSTDALARALRRAEAINDRAGAAIARRLLQEARCP
jgi:hypothetical protein